MICNLARITVPEVTVCHDRPFFNRASGRSFDIRCQDNVAEIDLYDEIGFFGVSAADFRAQLRAVEADTIRLRINSPGGDVFDGIAMFNDLLGHRARVEVQVTGLAASAASVVAMAGDEIAMAGNAMMMIHNAWAFVIGNRNDLAAFATVLAKIDAALADTYVARAGASRAEIVRMMAAATWLSAEEAVAKGFADRTTSDEEVNARFDLSAFARAPKRFSAESLGGPVTKRDFERALRDAGASKTAAAAMVAGGYQAVTARRDAGDDATLDSILPSLRRRLNMMKGNTL